MSKKSKRPDYGYWVLHAKRRYGPFATESDAFSFAASRLFEDFFVIFD